MVAAPLLPAPCPTLAGAAAQVAAATAATTPAVAADPSAALPALPVPTHAQDCLKSGDGYFRAHLGGAINTTVDWPDKGTRCEGESRAKPPGVRLSFQRSHPGPKNLLFVFGISGVSEGKAARDIGVNLTVFVQGTRHIYGTLGDSRCTVDALTQRALQAEHSYRVEARGFCTQPAHALRGQDALLVSTFEFAGLVVYDPADNAAAAGRAGVK
jgi:hypothetical protein